MSKFDNLFNRPAASSSSSSVTRNVTSSSVSTLEKKTNSFISRSDEDQKPKKYNFLEEEFPDLAPKQKSISGSDLSTADLSTADTKKYSDITSTVNEVAAVKSIPVLPGWTKYSVCKKTGKIEVKGNLSRYRDFIYIDEVVDAWFKAAIFPNVKNQIINVGSDNHEIIKKIKELFYTEIKYV